MRSPPIQRRAVESRERVVHAALRLFAEQGYERTSLEEIANRANVAVGSVYLHFSTKRQLLLVLMNDFLARLEDLSLEPHAARGIRAALHEMLVRAFSIDLTYLGACRAWAEATRSDPGLESLDRRIRAWTTERVRTLFERLQQAPRARSDIDLPALASTMDEIFWNELARASTLRRAEVRRFVDVMTALIYHALFKDDA